MPRRGAPGIAADTAAVLPAVRSSGASGRSQAAAERLDLRHRRPRRAARRRAEDGSRRRELEHLCRPRCDPLLPAARGGTAERLLRPGGRHRQGRGGARAAAGAARGGARHAVSQRGGARVAARARPAGRLAGAVSGQRSGRGAGARHRTAACRHRGGRSERAARQFRLDGAGPHGPDQYRPGSGPVAGPELAGAGAGAELRGHRHRPSRNCATASISSMSSRGRPTSSASRSRRCATCRFRCRTDGPCRSASSRASTSTRNSR